MVLVSGWNAISNQELPRIPHRTRKSDDEIIIINISGCRFMCWKSTLEVRPLSWGLSGRNVQMNTYFQKHPDSLLGSHERDFFFDEDAEEYFFDRDPEIFRHILSFFRTGMFFCLKYYFWKNLYSYNFRQASLSADRVYWLGGRGISIFWNKSWYYKWLLLWGL